MEADFHQSGRRESAEAGVATVWGLTWMATESLVCLRITSYCVITGVHNVGMGQSIYPEQLTKKVCVFKVVNKPSAI